jgi:hypothetical protein
MDNPLGRNWEKGLPLSSYVDATFRHLLEEVSGNGDDKSLISAIWNLMCYAETKHRHLPRDHPHKHRGVWTTWTDTRKRLFGGQRRVYGEA